MDTIPPRLWGRDRELELVTSWVGSGRCDAPALVVEGEPGIGKSSVWAHGVAAANGTSVVVSAVCASAEQSTPYLALEQLLSEVYLVHGAQLPEVQRDALDWAFSRAPRGQGRHQGDQRTVAAGVLGLLRILTVKEPVVLALDDVQWADDASQDCLAYAVRRLAGSSLGVLLAVRSRSPLWEPGAPSESPGSALLEAVHSPERLRLGPLDPVTLHRVLAERTGIILAPQEARRIAAETGGNPFWAIEFARVRAGGEALGAGATGAGGQDATVPQGVVAMIDGRLAGLDPDVVEVCRLVAVLGRPWPGRVAEAIGADAAPDVEMLLDRGIQAGLISVTGGRVVPSHPLVGSALLASLPPFERARLHRRAAGLAASSEDRAHHLLRAAVAIGSELVGDDEDPQAPTRRAELLAALDAAGVAAESRGAVASAARFADRALALAGATGVEAERRLRAAELHFRASGVVAAREILERVELSTLDADALERAGCLLVDATLRAEGGAAARAVVERVAELPVAALPEADQRRRRAFVATLRRDPRFGDHPGLDAAREAVGQVREAGVLPLVEHRALGHLVFACLDAGAPVEPEVLARRAALESAVVTSPLLESTELFRGAALFYTDRGVEAEPVLLGEYRRCCAAGDDAAALRAGTFLAYVRIVHGRPDDAETLLAALRDYVEWQQPEPSSMKVLRGQLHLVRAEHEAVEEIVRRERAVEGRTGDRAAELDHLRGLLALQQGRPADAVELLTGFVEVAESWGMTHPARRMMADLDLADALLAVRDLVAVDKLVEGLYAGSGSSAGQLAIGQVQRVRARLATARGDAAQALEFATSAVHAHHDVSRRPELGRSLLALAEAQRSAGLSADAYCTAAAAEEVFTDTGHRWWAAQAASGRQWRHVPGRYGILTRAEEAVVDLVVLGASNAQAAAQLHLSVRTVENHLRNAYRKYGVRSRHELAALLRAARG